MRFMCPSARARTSRSARAPPTSIAKTTNGTCRSSSASGVVSGLDFSLAGARRLLSLVGGAVRDATLLLPCYHELHQAGLGGRDGGVGAADGRIRPRLMAALSACLGRLPAAVSNGIGSQVQ